MKRIIGLLLIFLSLSASATHKSQLDNANVLITINSIAANGGSYWATMVHSEYPSATVTNIGVGGRNALDFYNSLISNPSEVGSHFVNGVTNVCVVIEGINNVRAQPNATQSANTHLAICDTLRARGWKVLLVIVSDVGASKQFFQNTDINFAFTDSLHKADSLEGARYVGHADGIFPWAENLQAANDPFDQTFYNGDFVHLNGNGYVASLSNFVAALESIYDAQAPVLLLGRPRVKTVTPSRYGVSVTIDRYGSSYTYSVDTSNDGGYTWRQHSIFTNAQPIYLALPNNMPYRVRVQSILGDRRSFYEYGKDIVMSGVPPVIPRTTITTAVGSDTLKFTHPVGFCYTDYEYRLNGGSWQPVVMTGNDNIVKVEYGTLTNTGSTTQDIRLKATSFTSASAILNTVLPPYVEPKSAITLGQKPISVGLIPLSISN